MNRGVAEGVVSEEGGKRWGWEDVAVGGVILKLMEKTENVVVAGGEKGEDQGTCILV